MYLDDNANLEITINDFRQQISNLKNDIDKLKDEMSKIKEEVGSHNHNSRWP